MGGLRFLIGRWVGGHATVADERVEEIWTLVGDQSLMGMFAWSQGGQPVLYEFVLIEATQSGVVMRMDTRTAGLTGLAGHTRPQLWRLTRCSAGEDAVFESSQGTERFRITYRVLADDRLYAQLERTRDGATEIFPYTYGREPLPSSQEPA